MSSLLPIVCNQVVTVLLGVAGVKLISALVPSEIYGTYALFLTLTQLGVLVTHSGIHNHAMRYWPREQRAPEVYARFLWNVSWRTLAYLGPLLILLAAGLALVERDLAWIWVLPWLVIGNMGMATSAIATGALNADKKLWGVFVLSAVGNAARILLPIGLALVGGMTFFVLSAGFALHGFILLACILHPFRHAFGVANMPLERVRQWSQELKDYGRPFVFLGIGGWLLQNADRWVVAQFFGEKQAGLFAFASNIGAIVTTLVVGGVMQRVFPEIFRQADHARSREEWSQIARRCDQVTVLFLGLALSGLLVLNAVAPHLVGWLISAEYAPSLEMLLPAGFAMITMQINQFHYLLLQGQHNSAGMVRVMMVVSGLKTAGSLIAASISWPVFLGWLILSAILCGLVGRGMIRSMALKNRPLI